MTHTTYQSAATQTSLRRRYLLWLGVVVILGVIGYVVWMFVRPTPQVIEEPVAPKVYLPVVYEPHRWQASAPLADPFLDTDALIAKLGAAVVETALDWQGNQASKYRFYALDEPPLYVVDSDKFFEITWYYAAIKDGDKDKQASQNYAQKAFVVGSSILTAKQSVDLFDAMLAQKDISLPKPVAYAQCQSYQCQIIFQK